MGKLLQWFKWGKGRGLRIVFYLSFLLTIVFGLMTYYSGKEFINSPVVSSFVKSVPSFVIKDGAIQNKDLRWASYVPGIGQNGKMLIVIDATQDELNFPVPDGLYVTRTMLYRVADYGTQIERSKLGEDRFISPAFLDSILYKMVASFSVVIGFVAFVFLWLSYLIVVALTALVGLILRSDLSNHRAWRVAAVIWAFVQLLSLVLWSVGIAIPLWGLLVWLVSCIIILPKLKD